jgi:hypothetical protein
MAVVGRKRANSTTYHESVKQRRHTEVRQVLGLLERWAHTETDVEQRYRLLGTITPMFDKFGDFWFDRTIDEGTVYLVRTVGRDYVKIGVSNNVAVRLEDLQTANPDELKLLASFPGGRGIERTLHELLGEFNVRSEWFYLVPQITRLVELANQDPAGWLLPTRRP